jgi:hypothetical protein
VKETRQVKRARERAREKENKQLAKKLELSDYTYVADDHSMTLSAAAPQIVDFMKVIGLPEYLEEHVHIDKRKSTYRSAQLSQFLIIQNILGYDRIESSRTLNQDHLLKEKFGIDQYPDPETFRDELGKYTEENMKELLTVNRELLRVLCRLTEPQYIDLHYDSKVITVYGNQEQATVGYNPHKHGRKSYHLKICTIEPFGFALAIHLQPGDAVSATDFSAFHEKCLAAVPQDHFVVHTVRMDRGFFGDDIIETLEEDHLFFEVVARQYAGVKRLIASIPDEDFDPLYPHETIYGASRTLCLDTREKPRTFVIVRKMTGCDEHRQTLLLNHDGLVCPTVGTSGPQSAIKRTEREYPSCPSDF